MSPHKCKICGELIDLIKMEKHSLNCLRKRTCYEKLEKLNEELFEKAKEIDKIKIGLIIKNGGNKDYNKIRPQRFLSDKKCTSTPKKNENVRLNT